MGTGSVNGRGNRDQLQASVPSYVSDYLESRMIKPFTNVLRLQTDRRMIVMYSESPVISTACCFSPDETKIYIAAATEAGFLKVFVMDTPIAPLE